MAGKDAKAKSHKTTKGKQAKAKGTVAEQRTKWDIEPEVSLRVGSDFLLSNVDRAATPGWSKSRKSAEKYLTSHEPELDDLQEKLFAHGRSGGTRSALVILQGMDTSGKGGIVRHVVGMVDPQGVHVKNFGPPTAEEASHHFLWRIHRALPPQGRIGVFDRSHYEDVLVARVRQLAPPAELDRRYQQINDFEQHLLDSGIAVLKCALLISPQEQRERLRERLTRPDKYWKYSTNDINERQLWHEYDQAYQLMFERTSTEQAPWFAIPADNKWYARLAVTKLLILTLRSMELTWPKADFDPEVELARLAKSEI